jgi:hypothetical protein
MACTNISCRYNDNKRPNGCTLFPGSSWLNCRGATVVPRIGKQTSSTQQDKRKGSK